MSWRGENPYYPAGATHDPNAPYNQHEPEEYTFDVEAWFSISRADIEVNTNDWEYDDGYAVMRDEAFGCDPVAAMENVAELLKKHRDLLIANGEKPYVIDGFLYALKGWEVDDSEIKADKIDIEPYDEEDRGSYWRDE